MRVNKIKWNKRKERKNTIKWNKKMRKIRRNIGRNGAIKVKERREQNEEKWKKK